MLLMRTPGISAYNDQVQLQVTLVGTLLRNLRQYIKRLRSAPGRRRCGQCRWHPLRLGNQG